MKLKLKEDPREWRKFGVVLACFITLMGFFLRHRRRIDPTTLRVFAFSALIVFVVAIWKPGWIRPIYRVAMRFSFAMGQVMGKVILSIFFFLILTPLGLLLRMAGKDLLKLRRPAPGISLWETPKSHSKIENPF